VGDFTHMGLMALVKQAVK